jgi:hypothetical protein
MESPRPKRKYVRKTTRTPLQRRATRLLRRGFDVPPSKEGEYKVLAEAGYKLAEIVDMLNLE